MKRISSLVLAALLVLAQMCIRDRKVYSGMGRSAFQLGYPRKTTS